MNSKYVIYALLCPKCGCPRYVGQTQDWASRLISHKKGIKSTDNCVYKKRWVQKLIDEGLEFKSVILLELPTREGLADAEKYWIKFLKERGCPLTNLTAGGDGGTLGLKNSPETIAKRAAHFKGVPKSEETKAKISATLTGRPSPKKGRPLTEEQLVKHALVRTIPPFEDQYGRVYTTIKEAAQAHSLAPGNICNVLKRKRMSAGGFVFTYVHEKEAMAKLDAVRLESKNKSKEETKARNRERTRLWKEQRPGYMTEYMKKYR
jgi:hypothetical protein